jgi:multidrug efflux system membrane fusion protein
MNFEKIKSDLKTFFASLSSQSPKGKLGLAIFFLIILGLVFWFNRESSLPITTLFPKVKIIKAEPFEYAKNLHLTGHGRASKFITLSAQVPGVVEFISENKGRPLKKGETLLKIESLDRLEKLEEAKARFKQRQAEYSAAEKLKAKEFKAENALLASKADLESARANLKKAEKEAENLSVTAPFEGIFQETFVEVGDYVNLGQKLATFLVLNPLKVMVEVSDQEARLINEEGEVQVNSALLDQPISAKITHMGKSANPTTRTLTVELLFDNPENKVLDGSILSVSFKGKSFKAYKIPPSALVLNDEGILGVMVVGEDKKTQFKPATILETQGGDFIISGTDERWEIVVLGSGFIKPGQVVEPIL